MEKEGDAMYFEGKTSIKQGKKFMSNQAAHNNDVDWDQRPFSPRISSFIWTRFSTSEKTTCHDGQARIFLKIMLVYGVSGRQKSSTSYDPLGFAAAAATEKATARLRIFPLPSLFLRNSCGVLVLKCTTLHYVFMYVQSLRPSLTRFS